MGKSVDIENKKMRKDVNVLPHRTAQPIGTLAYWHIDTLLIGTLLLFICLSFPLSSFAQSGEIEKTVAVADSLQTKKRPNGFIRAFNYLFNPNDIDTTYIGPNRYNYALMLDHFTNYEYYSRITTIAVLSQSAQQDRPLLRLAMDLLRMVYRHGRTLRQAKRKKKRYGIRFEPLQRQVRSGYLLPSHG